MNPPSTRPDPLPARAQRAHSATSDVTGCPEVYATYPHRGSVPRDVWRQLYDSAEQQIDILVYSGLFLAEDVEMIRLLGEKARAEVAVRIILGDPDSPHVNQRGDEEGIHDAMAIWVPCAIRSAQRRPSTTLLRS